MATKSGAGGLVYSVVAIAIIVLIVSTVAVPVIEDAQNNVAVEKQMSGQLYSAVGTKETITLGYSGSFPTFNGIEMPNLYPDQTRYMILTDTAIAVCEYTQQAWTPWYVKTNNLLTNTPIDDVGYSVLFENGTLTVTAASTSLTTYSWLMVPDKNGDYGVWNYTERPWFVDDDSIIYLGLNLNAITYVASGTLDALTVNLFIENGVLGNDVTVNVTSAPTADGQSNVLSGLSLDNAGTTVELRNFAKIFVPLKYHVIDDSGEALYNLIGILPILLFLVPVMFAVRMIQTRRN